MAEKQGFRSRNKGFKGGGFPLEPLVERPVASEVTAERGKIMMDGPDGVAVTMSPDAAEETAWRLLEAVREARGQDNGRGNTDG